jgi:hypothetical protein
MALHVLSTTQDYTKQLTSLQRQMQSLERRKSEAEQQIARCQRQRDPLFSSRLI